MTTFLCSPLVSYCKKLHADIVFESTIKQKIKELKKENKRTLNIEETNEFIVKPSLRHGQGLFAKTDLKKGTEIPFEIASFINDAATLDIPLSNHSNSSLKKVDFKQLNSNIETYQKTTLQCNAEEWLQKRTAKDKEEKENITYYNGYRLNQDVKAGEEILRHYYPESWIITQTLQTSQFPHQTLERQTHMELDLLCQKLVGSSQKRALGVYSYCAWDLYPPNSQKVSA